MKFFVLFTLVIFVAIEIFFYLIRRDRKFFKHRPAYIQKMFATFPYKRLFMPFKKWRKLFEIDPKQFLFADSTTGSIINTNQLDYNYRTAHPVFQNEDKETFLIDFTYWNYIQYYFYRKKIQNKFNSLLEEKVTIEIAEMMQKKIQAILDESQKQIQESLEKHREIVLRLNSDTTKKEN